MLKHTRQRDRITVWLAGELDHCSALPIKTELDRLIADPSVRHLIMDLQGLQFMDSSGIGVILGRYRTLAARGGSVSVRGMSAQINRIFQLSGMGQVIRVAEQGREGVK